MTPTIAGTGHLRHLGQALFVTFLWSTSWVLIKVGLEDLPALTFAGMRYGLAALILLPLLLRADRRATLRRLPARGWRDLTLLGVVLYALTQGTQFVALGQLPAATLSLVLSFTPLVVALLGAVVLREAVTARQGVGIGLLVVGAVVYFGPALPAADQRFGILVALVGLGANAGSGLLGRAIARTRTLDPVVVTFVSMATGGALLLTVGLATARPPALSPTHAAIVVWLAAVNTAFAFTLWNATLRHLTAVESSVVNNTMLVQIATLAWAFLGERLSAAQVVAIVAATLGALLVQWRGRPRAAATRR